MRHYCFVAVAMGEMLQEPPMSIRVGTPANRQGLRRRWLAGLIVACIVGASIVILTRPASSAPRIDGFPDARYSVFARAQTAVEAAAEVSGPGVSSSFIASTIRVQDSGSGRIVVARTETGATCLRFEAIEPPIGAEICGTPEDRDVNLTGTLWVMTYGEALGDTRVVVGLVPDGIRTVAVNGRAAPVKDNLYRVDIAESGVRGFTFGDGQRTWEVSVAAGRSVEGLLD